MIKVVPKYNLIFSKNFSLWLHKQTFMLKRCCHDKVTDKQKIKPTECPQEPTTCCMSGCPNCVWLDYAEKLSAYYQDGGERALKEINKNVQDANVRAFLLHEIRTRNKS